MKAIGGWLLFFGFASTVIWFMNMEFIILSWIDNWGETVAWVIRGSMIIVGAALMLLAQDDGGPESEI